MYVLDVNESFHGVGQGLFYSSELRVYLKQKPKGFSFIYDCGSEKRQTFLRNEILKYKKINLHSQVLNLLIISHLHKDHISGLDDLLSGSIVKQVVLPYLSAIERLYLAVSQNAMGWYADFLSNPTEYLQNKRVETIYYLTKGEGEKNQPPSDQNNLGYGGEDLILNIKHLEDGNNFEKELTNQNVFFKKDSKAVFLNQFWSFLLYVSPTDPESLIHFQECVKKKFNNRSLLDIIRTPNDLKELKDCYKLISPDINLTSLSCLHGPSTKIQILYDSSFSSNCCFHPDFIIKNFDLLRHYWDDFKICCLHHCEPFYRRWEEKIRLAKSYTHLLGDINTIKEWKTITYRYNHLFDRIEFFQVPHHGSKKSWLANGISQNISPNKYIISAGIRNQYGHPDKTVLDDIYQNCSYCDVEWVNEYHSFANRKIFLLN